MNKMIRIIRTAAMVFAIGVAVLAVTGCEDDDNTVTHKITFHNKSSYTVTQKVSGYGNITIAPGDKKAFDDDSLSMYDYSPKANVVRVRESSHTIVYKDK